MFLCEYVKAAFFRLSNLVIDIFHPFSVDQLLTLTWQVQLTQTARVLLNGSFSVNEQCIMGQRDRDLTHMHCLLLELPFSVSLRLWLIFASSEWVIRLCVLRDIKNYIGGDKKTRQPLHFVIQCSLFIVKCQNQQQYCYCILLYIYTSDVQCLQILNE